MKHSFFFYQPGNPFHLIALGSGGQADYAFLLAQSQHNAGIEGPGAHHQTPDRSFHHLMLFIAGRMGRASGYQGQPMALGVDGF